MYKSATDHDNKYDIHYIFLDMLHEKFIEYKKEDPIKIGNEYLDNDILLFMKLLTNNDDCSF